MASLSYTVGDNWGSGFVGDMTVAADATALAGWQVEFDASFTITNIWNAVIVSHVGTHYTIRNADWNASVAAGGQTSFGFQATPGSGGTSASGFLVNGEPSGGAVLPVLSVADATVVEGDDGTVALRFAVTLSHPSTGAVSVAWATADGPAKAGTDYTARSGTLTIAAGETTGTITVRVLGDTLAEGNETLRLDLSSVVGATLARSAATGTITDDDGPATLSISDAAFDEGSAASPGRGTFTVTLSRALATPVTVKYATVDRTAAAGSDYVAKSGLLTFAAGETQKTIRIDALGDAIAEVDERFLVRLSEATGATILDGSGAGTIRDDDSAAPPTLSIVDTAFVEGSSGSPGHGQFVVSLSGPSSGTVTVNYKTIDRTAMAGSDYVARTGTLTFAPGQTQKTIDVTGIGDGVAEGTERFVVKLSAATGATIADATATGTITDDDGKPPKLPKLSISDASVAEGDPGMGSGWLSTAGNQIIDSGGHSVQIAGVNWFGFESSNLAPHGLWTRGYKDMMDQMVSLGFNTIRLPFSSEMLHSTAAPNGIDFYKNPDLQGLSALQIMDKIVDYAGQIGLKIILDHHRSDSGAGTSGNGLWYDGSHSDAQWVADWKMLASRYADDPTVIGADLHNEPYNGTWGGGGATDWAAAAERAGNAIGTVNPNWLIFVEGVGTYQGKSYWWGGNLMGVKDRPIQLDVPNKLVYSAHDYPNSVYPQSWFQGSDFAASLPDVFDQAWGYIYREGIAPVWIGEFGTKLVDPKDAPWLEALTSYMSGDLDNDGTRDIPADQKGVSWTYWSWNPNSGDTGGILADDWRTVNSNKLAYLTPIEYAFDADALGDGSAGSVNHASFVVTLSAPATTTVTVAYHTVPGTAGSADFTSRSGTLTFAPGEQSKTVSIAITPDDLAEGNERFTVVLSDPVGATIADGTGVGTIVDDDGASAARSFSPYIDMAMPVDADLMAISAASGTTDFTLAFMLSSSEGIGWQGVGGIEDDQLANGTTILDQVRAVQAAGGNITISFGGAAGQEAALTAPSAAALQAEYQSVIDRYDITSIDFDIEGAAIANSAANTRRDTAIAGLQAANPDLQVSFTVPVLPTGLDANGLALLQGALQHGVRIDLVNIMAMDYGAAVDNGGQMGANAISAAEATQQQLAEIGLVARIGITPMIGVNDVAGEVFTLADAQALVDYAKADPDVALLSMWSVARDNGSGAGSPWASPDSSGIAQNTWDFSHVLQGFASST